ncbi:MAG TPA: YjfB family protein [Candidatus Aminicenantes bacterium]|nr:YjfB family protein [Candidatus Aminicenantes bacterium]
MTIDPLSSSVTSLSTETAKDSSAQSSGGMKVFKMALEIQEQEALALIEMLRQITPEVGGNINTLA